MSTVMEFIGLSPMGLNGIPAMDPAKDEAAFKAGQLVMDIFKRGVRPRDVLTRKAFENAIISVAALKTHPWTGVTFSMKNMFGAIYEQEKALRVLQPLILRIDSLAGPARIEVLLALAVFIGKTRLIDNIVITNSNRGIAFMVFDGGVVEDVTISNVTIQTRRFDWFWWGDGDPLHINIKRRSEVHKSVKPGTDPPAGAIRRVLIANVIARGKGGKIIVTKDGTSSKVEVLA